MDSPILLAVMGPTGSGKTSIAEDLAERLDAQLINADAFQVYRGMTIGTGKPIRQDAYELIDVKNPDDTFSVGEFVKLAHSVLTELYDKGRSAIVVGGTGLYIRALFEEYDDLAAPPNPALRAELNLRMQSEGIDSLADELVRRSPALARKVDLRNPSRVTRALERLEIAGSHTKFVLPKYPRFKIGLQPNPEVLARRIENRILAMVQNGWVQEVKELLSNGYRPEDPGFRAIGYRTFARHVGNEIGLEEAKAITFVETRRYAKRQRTWLRSEPNLTLVDPDQAGVLAEIGKRTGLLFF